MLLGAAIYPFPETKGDWRRGRKQGKGPTLEADRLTSLSVGRTSPDEICDSLRALDTNGDLFDSGSEAPNECRCNDILVHE